jgi:hypothetical protein
VIKILFDADFILEALIHRQEFTEDISQILDNQHSLIQMHITVVGWQKIYTYARCLQNSNIAKIILYWLQAKIHNCQVNQQILQQARLLPLKDFESAVELACLNYWQLDAIVTHKPEDFAGNINQLRVWSLADLCLRANLESQLQATIF